MSHLNQRIKKLDVTANAENEFDGVSVKAEGETEEEAIARVRASKPCRKVFLLQFVDAPAQGEPGVGVADTER